MLETKLRILIAYVWSDWRDWRERGLISNLYMAQIVKVRLN